MDEKRQPISIDIVWLVTFAALSSWWCLSAGRELGPTFDEPVYVKMGLERMRTGRIGGLMKLGTMPLPVDVQSLPLRIWELRRGQPFDPVADLPTVLPVARAANLVFWWLLLFYAMLSARALAGPWAGRAAVALLAVEPTFLAHAGLATTDMSVAACLLAFCYHFAQGRERGWLMRVGVPGLWLGLAALAKASGPVFGVLCMLAIEWQRKRSLDKPFRSDFLQVGAIGAALLLFYCGSDGLPQPDSLRWANKLPEGTFKTVALGVIETVRVFPNGAEGFVRQVTHNARGHGAYLLGVESRTSLWWYFPVLLTIKLTAPLLLLAAAVLLFARRHLGNAALAAALALLLFSFLCRVQIGIRFMLPLIALAVVGLCAAGARWATEAGPRFRLALASSVALVLAWNTAASARAWPHGLSFVNGFYRERAVSESNFDWGQGVPELRRWAAEHEAGRLAVWYYGADPAIRRAPFEPVQMHEGDLDENLHALRGRYLAVSACLTWGPPLTEDVVKTRQRLDELEPVARTKTFVIYRIQ